MKTDESAQATTEYILMVSFGVTAALLLIKKLIEPAFGKLSKAIANNLEGRLLKTDLHVYRVRR